MTKQPSKIKELCRFPIAGVAYGDYQLCLGLTAGSKVNLFWERGNPHDPYAIRIEYKGCKLGYVPKNQPSNTFDYQNHLHKYRDKGIKVYAELSAVNKNNPTWGMFTVKCYIYLKDVKENEEEQF
jgi:hypothetical protein